MDLHDWNVGKYAIQIRGKRWYILGAVYQVTGHGRSQCVDLVQTAAWKQCHGSEGISPPPRGGIISPCQPESKARTTTRPPTAFDDVRHDGMGHLICQRDQQRRCQRVLSFTV